MAAFSRRGLPSFVSRRGLPSFVGRRGLFSFFLMLLDEIDGFLSKAVSEVLAFFIVDDVRVVVGGVVAAFCW